MTASATTVDAAVIGGGIAGASSLYHLARRGISAALLEREAELGTQSTGRSAASLAPGYGGVLSDALTDASMPFLMSDGDGLAEHPLVTPRPLLWIYPSDPCAPTGDLPGADSITIDEALVACPSLRPDTISAATIQRAGYDIDVEELLQAYVRGARQHGAAIHRSTPARRLERDRDHWLIRTGDRDVRAGCIVNAAGAWADSVAAAAGLAIAGLRPLKRTAFVAPVQVETPQLPLVLAADHSFYFKPDVPGVLLCSRADETPVEPCDPSADEIDVAFAIDRINAHTTLDIRHVHRAWAGLRVFAPDRNPLVEPHRDDPRFIWCAGLGGTGVQTSPGVGARVADHVATALS
jgi:D-arginine dehydrogenase